MNQMGHVPLNLLGAHFGDLDDRIAKLLPEYMTMGEHGKHIVMGHMTPPKNSIPMVGSQMAFGYSGAGGMFTVLKVRDSESDSVQSNPQKEISTNGYIIGHRYFCGRHLKA